ncbi:MAG: hypothetical protein WBO46_17475 [Caldilineaceae bacterium]
MATQPTLGGQTLAHPSDYRESVEYRGGRRVMADGTQVTDLVNSSAKRLFHVEWNALTAAERTTLETAYAAVKDTTGSFKTPDNNTYTVTIDGDAALEFNYILLPSGSFRYATALKLRES